MLHRRASFMLIPIQTTGQLTAAKTVKFYAILVRKSMQYVDRDYSECWEEIRSVMFGVHLPKENSQPLTDCVSGKVGEWILAILAILTDCPVSSMRPA